MIAISKLISNILTKTSAWHIRSPPLEPIAEEKDFFRFEFKKNIFSEKTNPCKVHFVVSLWWTCQRVISSQWPCPSPSKDSLKPFAMWTNNFLEKENKSSCKTTTTIPCFLHSKPPKEIRFGQVGWSSWSRALIIRRDTTKLQTQMADDQ